jgi:hypothetical protein
MYRGKESCEEHMVLDEIRRPDHPAFKTKIKLKGRQTLRFALDT